MSQYQAMVSGRTFSALVTLAGAASLLLLSACQNLEPTPVPTKVEQLPTPLPSVTLQSNFAFVFEWGTCSGSTYTLNTFDNKLTLQRDGSPPLTDTIDIVPTRQELGTIFRKMAAINLFSYPEQFSIQLSTNIPRIYNSFPVHYRFDIRNGTQQKVVRWYDDFSEPTDAPWKAEDSEPSRTQAVKLRELIVLIQQTTEAYPGFEKLPGPGGCA